MKNFYSQYIDDDLWLIQELEWARPLQNIRESQFALGNGYFGARGVLEEIPYDAMPGTYLAGVFDKMLSQVAELVNLPNAFNFRFTVKGEKLDIVAMDVLKHKRILNLKKGLLARHTLYQNSKKSRFDYKSLRFASMDNKNIGVMQISITPLDGPCEIDINTGIDTSVSNVGVLTEGNKRHFRIKELGQSQDAGYLAVETLGKKHTIIYWSGFYYETNGKKVFARNNIFSLKLRKNQAIVFTKVFCIKRFPCDNNLSQYKKQTFKAFSGAFRAKFEDLIRNHIRAWKKLWEKADIIIEGTANLQQDLRFNIYHMLICANTDDGFSSIGARTLSGEGYRGHIFWDTEIFLMPFYLFNFPEVAKNILLYRYKRLHEARQLTKKEDSRGVRFPWESAGTGEEETPEWAKDIDGSIIKILTHKFEHHITSDISYALYKYYVATDDEKFMRDFGYEIIFETARFWASRSDFNKKTKKYEINQVIGPDEFHLNVNNNAYTNIMAKWNLIIAYKSFRKIKKDSPSLCLELQRKLGLKDKEVKDWGKIAPLLSKNINRDRIIEQFDGYFRLKKTSVSETDENGIPVISPNLKSQHLDKTQFVKQADTLMLIYLLSDVYSLKTKMANYNFYIQRTLHKSSLSPSIHSIIACICSDLQRAYSLFNVSLRMDISNLYGNTKEGIHGASLGGTWQAVVFGFAGVSITREKLCVNPRMPRSWKKMVLSLLWKADMLHLELTNNTIVVKSVSRKKKRIEIGIFDKITSIKPNKKYVFERKKPILVKEYHY
ncbi:MAG: glycoside hydrolase family 65 protein [Candidatus Omnitrophota bacterium]|nr:MAG: glycoside hydrolase family 65 protein [Candidatus Omnitrophota bacterium]